MGDLFESFSESNTGSVVSEVEWFYLESTKFVRINRFEVPMCRKLREKVAVVRRSICLGGRNISRSEERYSYLRHNFANV
jgi:hypothetical protein